MSQLQDQLNIASGNIPAELSTTLSSLQHDTLQWNGSAYDASHSSGTAQKLPMLLPVIPARILLMQ